MKKKSLIMVLFVLLSFNVFAKEYTFYDGTCYKYNTILETLTSYDYSIHYDSDNDLYYLMLPDYFNLKALVLDNSDIESLRKNIDKYFEWEKLAKEKQIKLEKQLPDSDICTAFLEVSGNDAYSNFNFVLKFIFFSQNTNNHQLVISAPAVPSDQNKYIDCSIDDLYFSYDQINDLYNAISEENIAAKKKEFEEQAAVEDLFQ